MRVINKKTRLVQLEKDDEVISAKELKEMKEKLAKLPPDPKLEDKDTTK